VSVGTSENSSDADLVRAVAAGDQAAVRLLFERHSAWLMLRLRRRSSNEDLVTEALQDTFVAVWRGASSFRGEGDVGAWLWGIAIRQLLNRLRKAPSPVPVAADRISAGTPLVRSAEDELLVAVEHGDVGTALRALSPELRAVLAATVIDGLSTREAARLLGLPQGTVKSRLRSAKVQLREQLIPIQGWEPR
jgi:RNA polymerase sigma factor (sigma-70 family)